MGLKPYLVTLFLTVGMCLAFLYLSQRELAGLWVRFGLNTDLSDLLVDAMLSHKQLAELDSGNETVYRDRFRETQSLLAHLEVLQVSRQKIVKRYNLLLFLISGFVLLALALVQIWRYRLLGKRLVRLRKGLENLASGEPFTARAGPRDVIGKIETMIAETGEVMAGNRKRLKYLENLAIWQEFSRGVAHEIRTPLTTIRLELKKIVAEAVKPGERSQEVLAKHERGLLEELTHLTRFTEQYTSFAKIGKPKKKSEPIADFLKEFVELYGEAWSGLELTTGSLSGDRVAMDRRLIRQVLVNLCKNSASALADKKGRIAFSTERGRDRLILSVSDTGPGLAPSIGDRLFEPYVTEGEGGGLGLGLAISKKIMLDHDGDLELDDTSARGTTFVLSFPLGEPRGGEELQRSFGEGWS